MFSGNSPRGAELLLWAPVHFQGNTVFAGRLNVRAGDDGKMNGPCIVVEGNLTLQPEARLSLEGCKNRAYESDRKGGCLHVAGDAELLSGHLCLRACDAFSDEVYSMFEDNPGGGGVFVGGRTSICCLVCPGRSANTCKLLMPTGPFRWTHPVDASSSSNLHVLCSRVQL